MISQIMVGVIGRVGRLVINIVGMDNWAEKEFVSLINAEKS